MLVKTINTICTEKELCKALIECWSELYQEIPSEASIGVIVAQRGIETGGGHNLYNYNIGNVKYSKSAGDVDYCALKGVYEIINGKRVDLLPSDPGSWFRSFPTLNEGVKFHLQLLKNTRYKAAWPAVEMGNVALFAHLLRAAGYYTASELDYTNGMNRYFIPFMKSNTYEQVLSELQFIAPPLQPWVEVNPEPAPMGDLTILPEPLPMPAINKSLTIKLKNAFSNFSQWFKPKS